MKATRRMITALLTCLLSVCSVSANFTPSVMQKPAPQVVCKDVDGSGAPVIVIHNEKNEVQMTFPAAGLSVTPMSGRQEASPEVREKLEAAHDQIAQADSLADLAPELTHVVDQLNRERSENLSMSDQTRDIRVEDLVVRDLIDVSIAGEPLETLNQPGNHMTLSFRIPLQPEEVLIVMHNFEGDQWEVIPQDRVLTHEDGTVDVTFSSLSPVAFVVNTEPEEGPEETEAPETEPAETVADPVIQADPMVQQEIQNRNTGVYVGIGVVAAAIVALVVLLIVKRKM